jgi:adenylate cyclase
MAKDRVERRLSAILAADVPGYSRLMGADEEGTLSRLTHHLREVIDPSISRNRGRMVKTTGDGLLAEFAGVIDAVRRAIEVQGDMAIRSAGEPDDKRIVFRIGINVGDIVEQDGDIFCDGVNIAARLESIAEPGGICVWLAKSFLLWRSVELSIRPSPRFRLLSVTISFLFQSQTCSLSP